MASSGANKTGGADDGVDSVKLPTTDSKGKQKEAEAQAVDSRNSTASMDPQEDENKEAQGNKTQSNELDAHKKGGKQAPKKKKEKINATAVADENEGAAVFLYEDTATGIK